MKNIFVLISLLVSVYSASYSQNLLNFIKKKEGFKAKAYRDNAGKLTIGYGQRINSSSKYASGRLTVTRKQAEQWLIENLVNAYNQIVRRWAGFAKVPQNQKDAIVSLAYNVGVGAATGGSMFRYFRNGDIKTAASRILLYDYAGGRVLRGLRIRREQEAYIFLHGWKAYHQADSQGRFN